MTTKKWTKSTFCADSSCLEVAPIGDVVVVRNNSDKPARELEFPRHAWVAFVDGVRAGEFNHV